VRMITSSPSRRTCSQLNATIRGARAGEAEGIRGRGNPKSRNLQSNGPRNQDISSAVATTRPMLFFFSPEGSGPTRGEITAGHFAQINEMQGRHLRPCRGRQIRGTTPRWSATSANRFPSWEQPRSAGQTSGESATGVRPKGDDSRRRTNREPGGQTGFPSWRAELKIGRRTFQL